MSYDLRSTFEFVNQVVKSGVSVRTGMYDLITYCQENCPSEVWDGLRKLEFENDVSTIRNLLEKTLSIEPPDERINAFWFGIFNPTLDNGETSCGLYVAGSNHFDAEDKMGDWACDPSYFPEGRYLDSQILRKIYFTVPRSGSEVARIGEYALCLGYTCLAIIEICKTIDPNILLGSRDSRSLAAGFDSGDFILLGRIDRSHLRPHLV